MFAKKQMQAKAARWINEMKRTRRGMALFTDSIPGDLKEAKALALKIFDPRDAEVLGEALDLAFPEGSSEPEGTPTAQPVEEGGPPPAGAARFCAECFSWAEMGSKIKGKMIPGGPGKCTREGGLCENHVPREWD